jgi:hypothetical protein
MIALLSFTTLAVATLFALAAASAFHWLLLYVTVRVMRPATARRSPARTELVRGTTQLARAFVAHR